jgi:hypothetical protein
MVHMIMAFYNQQKLSMLTSKKYLLLQSKSCLTQNIVEAKVGRKSVKQRYIVGSSAVSMFIKVYCSACSSYMFAIVAPHNNPGATSLLLSVRLMKWILIATCKWPTMRTVYGISYQNCCTISCGKQVASVPPLSYLIKTVCHITSTSV